MLYRETHALPGELAEAVVDGTRKEFMETLATVPVPGRGENILEMALCMPAGAALTRYQALAAPAEGLGKIANIQALQLKDGRTLIRVDTDAGISGYGECNTPGPAARSAITAYNGAGRLPNLAPIGKDPLAIQVHFHNM